MPDKPPPRASPPRRDPTDASYREELERTKRESTVQVLFKVARLLDELALERTAAKQGTARLRRSHTSLLPHIALEGTRITDLADRLGISKQAVSQLVDDLEAYGVVARVSDPEDARARRVIFTERGKKGLLEGLALLRGIEAEIAQQIGPQRMKHLREALLLVHDCLVDTERSSHPAKG